MGVVFKAKKTNMDVVLGVKRYISRMIEESGAGMKVLVMDKDTITIVSMVYSQSEILQREVFLFELLSNGGRETMKHLNCICFIRPTPENVDILIQELRNPKYGSYFLYFSNMIDKASIEKLAEADDHESVREVKEFFGDYLAVNQHLFTAGIEYFTLSGADYKRIQDGILAVFLALKKKPYVRYSASSNSCRRLAEEIDRNMNHRQERRLFDFRNESPQLLLVLDRKDDPITPLLNQWTYQAMVHEIFGIKNNRVDLSSAKGIKKELQEIVLSAENDDFFRENMYLNFGEIGGNIKTLVSNFQDKQKSHAKIESISDMKAFVENYPQFRKLSGTVSKHVAVVSELSRVVQDHHLMDVSELEQDIVTVTQSDRSTHLKRLETLISNQEVRQVDCLRLAVLYALRYETQFKGGELDTLSRLLIKRGISDQRRKLVDVVLDTCGHTKRSSDIFQSGNNPLSVGKRFFQGLQLQGVENVYTRHKPMIAETLEALVKGKLKDSSFPYAGTPLPSKPQDVFVFIVGGVTYAEAHAVAQFNKTNQGMRVVLGSNYVINSEGFYETAQRLSPSFGVRSLRQST